MMFRMLQTVGKFSGLPTDNPKLPLRLFLEVYDSFRQQCVPKAALKLKAWLNTLLSGIVASWNEICQRFLLSYNPLNMNAKLNNDIKSFRKSEDKKLYEAWE
ncbi:protein FAR1-RELATED SEQUENCE 5-like [Gossypium australe]|uniref:Protein FAR1-RELATED SEQUENCE 5-like n=1 Tax=Gossypium australe TaxID=47621 RepID=A0A5B6VL59_9ROSI|nr:protein FAR1-RELATED SEQUENCE 5-like [Gossypium australe]